MRFQHAFLLFRPVVNFMDHVLPPSTGRMFPKRFTSPATRHRSSELVNSRLESGSLCWQPFSEGTIIPQSTYRKHFISWYFIVLLFTTYLDIWEVSFDTFLYHSTKHKIQPTELPTDWHCSLYLHTWWQCHFNCFEVWCTALNKMLIFNPFPILLLHHSATVGVRLDKKVV